MRGPWLPGQSGNPSGRPALPAELRRALREEHGPRAVELMANLVSGKIKADAQTRLIAAERLLDRAYGRVLPAGAEGASVAAALVLRFAEPGEMPPMVTIDAEETP